MGFNAGPETNQTTISPDNSATANDQGVVNLDRRATRNQGNVNLRFGRGASYTVNNGLGSQQFDAIQSRIDSAIGSINRNQAGDDAQQQAIRDRIIDNVQSGSPSVTKRFGIAGIALAVAGVIALVVIGLHKRVKKKA